MNDEILQLTAEEMEAIVEPEEGLIVFNTDDETYYIWKNNCFNPVNPDANINLNLYDMNKQIISQLPIMEKQQRQLKYTRK